MNSLPDLDTQTNDALSYPWPPLSGYEHVPVWTGRGFMVGADIVPILSYDGESSGWTDELTAFHEDVAGEAHPIDRASRRQALEQLRLHVSAEHPTILEVGCSSGFMLREIAKQMPRATLIGADYVRGPLEKLAVELPDVPLMQFDLTHCPLPNETLDAVVALNVLEHIRDDRAAIAEIRRILKPGGVGVIEVPAGPNLFDAYDKLLMHYRRYALKQAAHLFEEAGFELVKRSHLGFFVYPLFWLAKQRNKRFLTEEGLHEERLVETQIRKTSESSLLDLSLRLELSLGRWTSYPVGVRCLLTVRKPFGVV
jgi:ubiquinone/menaquinone biosynthesis C-methylase UbiE